MIKAVIFDMDGLLIDSEPLWRLAEISIFRKVNLSLTDALCQQTMGLKIDQVVEHWYQQYPWSGVSKEQISGEIIEEVCRLIKQKGEAHSGVKQIINFFKQKNVPLALASSSHYKIVEVVLDKLEIKKDFELIYSAQDEPYGKPHPGIYISAAKKLNVFRENCLALEDSLNGLISAKAASMKCLMVPDASLVNSPKICLADLILPSLDKFTDQHWQQLN